jgi:hypothetical protein
MLDDNSGVGMIVEYILTFIIASVLFMIILLLSNGLLEGPQRTVSIIQYTDIGNDITAKMVDTYLIVPENGNVSTTFDMPLTVAGKAYLANVRTSANNDDKEVVVYSPDSGISITTTLNGVNSTIPVSGNTSSLSYTHRIYYQKT